MNKIIISIIFYLCLSLQIKAEWNYKLGGRLFVDGGTFLSAPSGFNSNVRITDLRLTGKLSSSDGWYTKLDVGFAKNKIDLKDAFLQRQWREHLFRAGYMIGMFSLDQSSSTNDYLFMTGANIAETFYPGRRVGLSYTYSGNSYYTSMGLFFGDGLNFTEKIKQGNNATLRMVYRPLNKRGKLFHIGSGALYKTPDMNQETGMSVISTKTKGTTYLAIPALLDLNVDKVKRQYQWNVETLLQYNRGFLQAEFMKMWINRTDGLSTYTADGGYIEGGLLLRGKSLAYDQTDALPVCPDEPQSILVFGRFNCTNLNHSSLKCGKQYDVSLGVNYYMNNHIIVRFNYSYLWLDKFSVFWKNNFSILQTRLQVKF